MTCPSKLCPASGPESCGLTVCAFDLPAFRRFQLAGGFLAIAPSPGRRKPAPAVTDAAMERSREWLRLYVEDFLTLGEIGARFNVTRERVRQILKRDWGVTGKEVRPSRTSLTQLLRRCAKATPCPECGAWNLRTVTTCSPECEAAWPTSPRRFWAKVDRSGGPDACWPWLGHINGQTGYSHLWWDRGYTSGHRVAYMLVNGPIPEGLTIDHVWARGCRLKHCVNPAHLEAVTHRVNVLRSQLNPCAINARKTHCPAGHLYETGPSSCKACVSARRSRGLEPTPPRVPCAAVNSRTGEPCKRGAQPDSDVCHIHADDWAEKVHAARSRSAA